MKQDFVAISASKQKSVSYTRTRDYSKQFNVTYEFNQDLYECYTETRKVTKKGYMASIKKIWDEFHPELYHFTEQYLRQQATYIEKRGYLLKTANVTNSNIENCNNIATLKQIYKLKITLESRII